MVATYIYPVLRHMLLLSLSLSVHASCLLAEEVRMRAREHYETVAFRGTNGDASYSGFTNTINVWYERPYQWSIGLAGSPLLATLRTGSAPEEFGKAVRLVHLGLEGKLFPLASEVSAFIRGGVFDARLDTYGEAGRIRGYSMLAGVGYEFDLGGIGLAPELAWRWGALERGVSFVASAPAIGVHFYKLLGNTAGD